MNRPLTNTVRTAIASRSATSYRVSFCSAAPCYAESSSTSALPSSSSPSEHATRGRRGRPQRNFLPPYSEWIKGPGRAFEDEPKGRGPFWIGSTPFPLNPTFNPPPPVSQEVRDSMWLLHVKDPKTNTVRSLSSRFGVQMDRVEAILRLMALENEWGRDVSARSLGPILGRVADLRQKDERKQIRLVLKTQIWLRDCFTC